MTTWFTDYRVRWAVFALIALITLAVYSLTAYNAGQGHLLMPLDDVYIHFQYARQMALGHPYQYNLIDPPTSGATSFLYPYLLAVGYRIGFQGLWLGLWAMLLGAAALFASLIAVYRLCIAFQTPIWLSALTTLSFGLTGSIAWHFMSGMETGLMIAFTLWTLLLLIEKRLLPFVMVASLLALLRPEGGVLAVSAAAAMLIRLWQSPTHNRRSLLLLLLPFLMLGVQPVVNALITGTTVATGNQAKSLLATVPPDTGAIIARIMENALRMLAEFITGIHRDADGIITQPLLGLVALLTAGALVLRRDWRIIGLLLLMWVAALTAAISTLDTAFWHFKRYQMPLIALFFPLAAWGMTMVLRGKTNRTLKGLIYAYGAVILPLLALNLALNFIDYHATNVRYVYQQPFQMATWLRENTPPDALVAVHDVGLMRYLGERSTLDIVGLTTPSAAAYWRNGPGSVAEFIMNNQPDYIASYGRGHGYGLAFLADTALYANPQATFVIDDWQRQDNVALAADSQAIYQSDWSQIQSACTSDALLVVDVADLASEGQMEYQWQSTIPSGFATEARQFGTIIEGYRRINGYEQFTLPPSDESRLLTTMVHAVSAGELAVLQDGQPLASRWIPEIPGQLHILQTIIPPTASETVIRIVAKGTTYQPVCHSLTAYDATLVPPPDNPIASYQEGAFSLIDTAIDRDGDQLTLDLSWFTTGAAQGDYRLFVHLYDNPEQPPVVQWDGYPAGTPPGNWLSGITSATIALNVAELPAGNYALALGFYNPHDPRDRLMPFSELYEITPDGRLWLMDIEVE